MAEERTGPIRAPSPEGRTAAGWRELERTVVGRRAALGLVVSFVLVVLTPSLWRLLEPPHPEGPGSSIVRALADAAEAASGALAGGRPLAANAHLRRALERSEDRLEQTSPVRRLLLAPLTTALSGWGGAPTPRVYPGRHGWLFLRSAVDHVVGPGFLEARREASRRAERLGHAAPAGDPLAAMLELEAELSRREVLLLVLPVPGKVTIHPHWLSAFASTEIAPRNPDLAPFLAALEDKGVVVLDPTALLREARADGEQYLRTDSHWRPEAVDRVARARAATVTRLEGEGRLALAPPVDGRFVEASPQVVEGRGDLVPALGLGKRPWLYPLQRVEIRPVRELLDGRAAPWRSSADAEILLLGDSFTNVYSQPELGWGTGAGLAERLSFALARPLDRIAINAGGLRALREALARSGDDRLTGKRLVIYQLASRELSSGDWPTMNMAVNGR
jgi:alginate O-acetyltransferase complex protein AlgJ